MLRKGALAVSLLSAVCLMSACSFMTADYTQDTVVVNKKGTVSGIIVEAFDKDYYNGEELEQMIHDEITAYNDGGEAIELKKFEITEEGNAFVNMTYQSAADYKSFNEKELFTGTVLDAYNAGYEFVDMQSVEEGGAGIQADEVLEKGSMHIVIFEEPVEVRVSGAITYVSEGVSIIDKKSAKAETSQEEESQKIFYIIYE